MGKTLQFNKDQNLSIEGAEYRVTGGVGILPVGNPDQGYKMAQH
mgnify:CR=1 FL=1